jgi:hypothetical protein
MSFLAGTLCGDTALSPMTPQDLLNRYASGENNFKGAILVGIDLSKADLIGINFQHADMESADLTLSYLTRVNFQQTNLAKAQLAGANLNQANLTKANLSDANLHGASLQGTDLRSAVLTLADLMDANLLEADLRNADLSGANLAVPVCEEPISDRRTENMSLTCEELIYETQTWKGPIYEGQFGLCRFHSSQPHQREFSGCRFAWLHFRRGLLEGGQPE